MLWSKIKNKLDEKNMTEYQLGKITGLGPQQIHQLKKRNSENPRWLTMIKIADALDISLDEFREKGK
ncbi:helix-turn-helix domain-containing protein [Lactococcus kimchii]|uniref:helix-turn-helix domain-containing protein n=1 Tax=Lactococcus sp. S-13 TaxID=2507158 RepID=UPI001023D1E4|nr:helix-turn-helix transcriptional regulator [Lactococcus sp. S-13]RZI47988.1 XRE family transcriptional regulator [Lactococcus sp. S-13]RZI48456.1 XRE family transcriptional regulator [Lactococcus sp. S-13]RZI49820.1 XRE family transcriptional regulator [Lactococcus sp. S-13]